MHHLSYQISHFNPVVVPVIKGELFEPLLLPSWRDRNLGSTTTLFPLSLVCPWSVPGEWASSRDTTVLETLMHKVVLEGRVASSRSFIPAPEPYPRPSEPHSTRFPPESALT